MKNRRSLSITLTVLALAATSIGTQAKPASATESWHTYRQSFLPALEVTADGDLREVTDPAPVRAMIGRNASVAHLSHADREAFRQRVLGEFDVNGDGRLDELERAAVHAAIKAGRLSVPGHTMNAAPVTQSTAIEG